MEATNIGLVRNQLMCISPEKKRRTYKFFDPIPHLDETSIFIIKIICNMVFGTVRMMMNIGAIFCHVKNIAPVCFESFTMRAAPQKCRGASLVFRSSPSRTQWDNRLLVSVTTPPLSTTSVPILCTTKYNILVFLADHLPAINVINAIRLISIINQSEGQVSVETLPTVPNNTPVHIGAFS